MSSFSNYAHWNNNESYDFESVTETKKSESTEKFSNTNLPSCGCNKKDTLPSEPITVVQTPLEGYSNLNNGFEVSNNNDTETKIMTVENKITDNNNLLTENFANELSNIKWVCTYGPNLNNVNENTWSCNPSEQ